MALKQLVENHPVMVLLACGAAVASSTAGIVQYFAEKASSIEHSRIQMEHKLEVSALQTRLASIERQLGDDKYIFDISRLILAPDGVRTLSDEYKTMADGQFFVAEPSMSDWTYSFTSEFALLKASMSLSFSDLQSLESPLGKQNLHLWRSAEEYTVQPKLEDDATGALTFNFFPYVVVQTLKISEIPQLVAGIDSAIAADLEGASKRIDGLLKEIDEDAVPEGTPPEDFVTAAGAPAGQAEPASTTPDGEPTGAEKLQLEEELSELFRGDAAAIMLGGLIGQTTLIPSIMPGSKAEIRTIQKKGNVLYTQVRYTFANVAIAGGLANNSIIVNQEFFIVTYGDILLLIKTQVPTVDGRSDAFHWVNQWLSGVRIPIGEI